MPDKKSLGKIVPIVLILSIVIAALLYWKRTIEPKPLVYGGSLEARTVNVGSLVGGRVTAVHVDEGSIVTAGQPIVTLETETIDRQLAEQRAAITASIAALAQAEAGPRQDEIEKAAAIAENDQRELRRNRELYSQGIVSRQSYDAAATKARASSEDLQLLRRGARPEDIAVARAEVERQRRHLDSLMKQRAETVVKASAGGVVQSFGLRPGDLVAPNQAVAEILETGQLWVRVYIPETLLGHVAVNQKVKLRIDTFPDVWFNGTVATISSQGEYTPRNVQTRAQRAEQLFAVKVNVAPDARLKAGMAAEVDFNVMGRK